MSGTAPATAPLHRTPSNMEIPPRLLSAYDHCARIAARHYENFPVASRLLPAGMRPHVAAIYAFARTADDFADEGDRSAEVRLALLDAWRDRLLACADGRPVEGDPGAALVFSALGHTIEAHNLPVQLLDDLLSAFRQDVSTTRYESWSALLDYCRRSANPVGRLVLRVAGYEDAALDRSSDALCTALQLTNFWQDLAVDWSRGRVYLPLEEARGAGATVDGLDPGRLSPEWQRALAGAIARTRTFFEQGRGVCDGVGGRLGYELRVTWLGGMTILDRVSESAARSAEYQRPSLSRGDVPGLLWRAFTWRAR